MLTNLYGNPHSMNVPAHNSGKMVDYVREKTLRFLGADPEHFDLVFVANATAAIKLVGDGFRDLAEKASGGRFWYGFHKDAHTSLVGLRELTGGLHHCFESDDAVERWLADADTKANTNRDGAVPGLFAYPGQSNMTGHRLPLSWAGRVRDSPHLQGNTYTLLDAAALAMTSNLEHVFADPIRAPDFTCLSFYKIFGFPDLGGLVIRHDTGGILAHRKYFGGGTVMMVNVLGDTAWHQSKGLQQAHNPHFYLHDGLEDGTLPFHAILALGEAIDVHQELYGDMANVSRHTSLLVRRLHDGLARLRYVNGTPMVRTYGADHPDSFGDPARHGGTVAFNLLRPDNSFIPYSEVETQANAQGFYIRSGAVCCPGGMATGMGYQPWEVLRALSAGHACGYNSLDLVGGKPTGVVRASLGAMTTVREVDTFVAFLAETFVHSMALPVFDKIHVPSLKTKIEKEMNKKNKKQEQLQSLELEAPRKFFQEDLSSDSTTTLSLFGATPASNSRGKSDVPFLLDNPSCPRLPATVRMIRGDKSAMTESYQRTVNGVEAKQIPNSLSCYKYRDSNDLSSLNKTVSPSKTNSRRRILLFFKAFHKAKFKTGVTI